MTHTLYRDTTFEAVSATLETGSVDSINFNTMFDPFCIAVVDVDLSEMPAPGFRTSFSGPDGSQYDVDWTVAEGKFEGIARGVFLVPGNTVSASTVALETGG